MSDHKLKWSTKMSYQITCVATLVKNIRMVNAIINALVVCACPHALLRNLSSLYTYNAWWF